MHQYSKRKKVCPLKEVEKGFEVHIPQKIYDEIMYLVDKSPVEISGLGKCKFEDGVFKILSNHVPTQINTATSTDLEASSVAEIEVETIKDDGHLNFWWHSHANMRAFWSGTDTDTIEEYGRHGFCLATVFNKRHETKTAYYQGSDGFKPAIFLNDLTLVITGAEKESRPELDAIYEERCKRPKYVAPVSLYGRNTQKGTGKSGTSGRNSTLVAKKEKAKPNTLAKIISCAYRFEMYEANFLCHAYLSFDDGTYTLVGRYNSKPKAKEAVKEWKKEQAKRKELENTPVVADKDKNESSLPTRVEGEIHRTYPNLRWSNDANSFISHAKWVSVVTSISAFETILDDMGIRELSAEAYFLDNPQSTGVTDEMVEEWYMKEHNILAKDFYYGLA